MRTYGSLAVLAIAAAAAMTSCTLLVQFHDAASEACEGGFCAGDATAPGEGGPGGHDSGSEAAPEAGEAGHDAPSGGDGSGSDAGVDHYAPCGNLASGYYCATDGLHGYAGSVADLVQCEDGGIAKVTNCDGGCLPLPAPFPDACNPCPGHGDGIYCGRDLAGFPAINADFLIQCQGGNVVQSVACAHGCKSSGTASSCYP
ncbi:MAG TPA: hypothetical protein VIF09_24115 [Polyangiaceae bacterium]